MAAGAPNDASDIGLPHVMSHIVFERMKSYQPKTVQKRTKLQGERPHVYRRAQCAHPLWQDKKPRSRSPQTRKKARHSEKDPGNHAKVTSSTQPVTMKE